MKLNINDKIDSVLALSPLSPWKWNLMAIIVIYTECSAQSAIDSVQPNVVNNPSYKRKSA